MTRIVLDESIRAIVDRIQETTRSSSPSQAIALLVSRYGRHLIETWELDPTRYPDPDPSGYMEALPPPQPDFRFSEPIDGL